MGRESAHEASDAQCANPQTVFVHEGQPPPDWRRIPRESTCLTESGSPRDGVGAPQAGGFTLKVRCVARRGVSYKRRPELKGLNTSYKLGVPPQVAEPLLSCNQIVCQVLLWIRHEVIARPKKSPKATGSEIHRAISNGPVDLRPGGFRTRCQSSSHSISDPRKPCHGIKQGCHRVF